MLDLNLDGEPDDLDGGVHTGFDYGLHTAGGPVVVVGTDVGGTVRVYHPNDPARFDAITPFVGFSGGVRVAGADLTGDGVPDLVVGAFAQDGDGKAYVFDGQSGKLLHTLAPPQAAGNSAFGWAVARVGDLNKDGIPDILVGAPYTTVDQVTVQGRAYVFSGHDGTALPGVPA
jgi:hypothetical protein